METQNAVAAAPPSLWSSIREAVRGSHQDYTTGSLNRAILLLAIPMVLEMVLESLFAVVDVFWVGRLGADAIATVGLTESLLSLVFAVGLGLSLSTTAMVARRIGERDASGAAVAGVQAIALGLAVSLAIGLPCFFLAPRLLQLMGASPQVVAVGSGYARIALGGSGAILMLFLNNAIFRGAGDAAIAMRLLWVSNIINLVLDPCLIFGWGPFPKLGVTGAALATFTGRSIGVGYQFYRLLRGSERIRILRQHIRINFGVLLRLVRVSLTGILQFAIAHTSWIGLVRIVSIFGSAALAGYTIAIRIVIFVILPSWGLSNAAATLVGQNLGAKQPERAASSVWRTGFYNMIFLGIIGLLFVVFAEPIVKLFTHDPAVVPLAASCLRIISYGNIGYAYGMVMLQAFNGAGDTVTPTIVNFFGFWLLEIPLAYFLAIPDAHAGAGSVFFDRCRGSRDCRGQYCSIQTRALEKTANLRLVLDFGSFREIARGSSLLYVEFCPFQNSLLGDCMRNSRGLFLALSLLISCTVLAQEPQSPVPIVPKKSSEQAAIPTPPSSPQISHSLDATDLGAFFDGIIPLQLERADIAGASVLVMKDGKVLLQKGYGFADAKEQKPVDPATTVFRLASISKLFTWISVMQLQEQGKLDLDVDVNNYLDFKIRPAFDKPVTLRNLMTHTGGFEEEARDILLIKPTKVPNLREFLIENQPRRLFPPGIGSGLFELRSGTGELHRAAGERTTVRTVRRRAYFCAAGDDTFHVLSTTAERTGKIAVRRLSRKHGKAGARIRDFQSGGRGWHFVYRIGHGPFRAGAAERRRTRWQANFKNGNAGRDVYAAVPRQQSTAADLHGIL